VGVAFPGAAVAVVLAGAGPAVALAIGTGTIGVGAGPADAVAIGTGRMGVGPAADPDGAEDTAPPRTKFHEHVTVEVVPGGAPGKFADNPCGAEPVMLVSVAAPSITGNVHSST